MGMSFMMLLILGGVVVVVAAIVVAVLAFALSGSGRDRERDEHK